MYYITDVLYLLYVCNVRPFLSKCSSVLLLFFINIISVNVSVNICPLLFLTWAWPFHFFNWGTSKFPLFTFLFSFVPLQNKCMILLLWLLLLLFLLVVVVVSRVVASYASYRTAYHTSTVCKRRYTQTVCFCVFQDGEVMTRPTHLWLANTRCRFRLVCKR